MKRKSNNSFNIKLEPEDEAKIIHESPLSLRNSNREMIQQKLLFNGEIKQEKELEIEDVQMEELQQEPEEAAEIEPFIPVVQEMKIKEVKNQRGIERFIVRKLDKNPKLKRSNLGKGLKRKYTKLKQQEEHHRAEIIPRNRYDKLVVQFNVPVLETLKVINLNPMQWQLNWTDEVKKILNKYSVFKKANCNSKMINTKKTQASFILHCNDRKKGEGNERADPCKERYRIQIEPFDEETASWEIFSKDGTICDHEGREQSTAFLQMVQNIKNCTNLVELECLKTAIDNRIAELKSQGIGDVNEEEQNFQTHQSESTAD